jgi:RNA polymerase sigma-70 factor (sigma-E family)
MEPPGPVGGPRDIREVRMTEMTSSATPEVAQGSHRASRLHESRARGRVARAYEAHAAELGRLAFLLTGDAGAAEDLVHEAFVRGFARFNYLRREEAFGAYLRRTLVNLAVKSSRRERTERMFLAGAAAPSTVVPPDLELREQLWCALRQLPQRQRAALVLRFYADLSERETARVLNCRVGTVKSLVHRGLAAMRAEIGGTP